MAKRFHNRCANDLKAFLEANGFKLTATNGDDSIYTKDDGQYTVKVPTRNEDMPNGTMMYIVKMIEKNGIGRKEIIKWWKENGYGD